MRSVWYKDEENLDFMLMSKVFSGGFFIILGLFFPRQYVPISQRRRVTRFWIFEQVFLLFGMHAVTLIYELNKKRKLYVNIRLLFGSC